MSRVFFFLFLLSIGYCLPSVLKFQLAHLRGYLLSTWFVSLNFVTLFIGYSEQTENKPSRFRLREVT